MGAFMADRAQTRPGARLVATSSKKGGAPLHHFAFQPGDILLFGPETRGLPAEVFALAQHRVRIPMLKGRGRCINLSTSCGIVLYQALAASGAMEGGDWEPE
jgi:tRNA (cytidine/uridine-2'-O-)-methyltransferase